MVKTTGAEWNRFYNDKSAWKPGYWQEDEKITVDGMLTDGRPMNLPPDAKVTISGGYVYGANRSLESFFKAWKKKQSTVTFVVEVSKDKADEIKAAVKSAGGKVA